MNGFEKVAPVTGVAVGIGRTAALTLLKKGYQVVLTGRCRDPLENTATDAGSAGTR